MLNESSITLEIISSPQDRQGSLETYATFRVISQSPAKYHLRSSTLLQVSRKIGCQNFVSQPGEAARDTYVITHVKEPIKVLIYEYL